MKHQLVASFLTQTFSLSPLATFSQVPFTPGTFGSLQFRARVLTSGSDSIRLVNFTVRRIPQQLNP